MPLNLKPEEALLRLTRMPNVHRGREESNRPDASSANDVARWLVLQLLRVHCVLKTWYAVVTAAKDWLPLRIWPSISRILQLQLLQAYWNPSSSDMHAINRRCNLTSFTEVWRRAFVPCWAFTINTGTDASLSKCARDLLFTRLWGMGSEIENIILTAFSCPPRGAACTILTMRNTTAKKEIVNCILESG